MVDILGKFGHFLFQIEPRRWYFRAWCEGGYKNVQQLVKSIESKSNTNYIDRKPLLKICASLSNILHSSKLNQWLIWFPTFVFLIVLHFFSVPSFFLSPLFVMSFLMRVYVFYFIRHLITATHNRNDTRIWTEKKHMIITIKHDFFNKLLTVPSQNE